MKRLFALMLGVFLALALVACGVVNEPSEEEVVQQLANEYIAYFVRNAGFVAETTARVLNAGYDSAENGNRSAIIFGSDGIIYLTIQSRTRGGGISTGDWVILVGGEDDKRIGNVPQTV